MTTHTGKIRVGEKEIAVLKYVKNVYPFTILKRKTIDVDDIELEIVYTNEQDLIDIGREIQRMLYPVYNNLPPQYENLVSKNEDYDEDEYYREKYDDYM